MKLLLAIALSLTTATAFALGARAPAGRSQVIAGWPTDYSAYIETKVASTYPELLDLPQWRMNTFCPNWSKLSATDRRQFWSSLLWSIAGPESERNRTLIYLEDTMDTDPVTGYQVRSEGLLQLSYQDVPNYGYRGGDISWTQDKSFAKADYDAKKKYGNSARTILDAYANINLGLWIMRKHLEDFNPNQNLEDALGKYWYVMQSRHEPFTEVLNNMKGRMPGCF